MAVAKFNATVSFDLSTEIEPEGVRFDSVEDIDGIGEFEDSSYFGAQSVTADGGSLSFEITAEDEDEARSSIEEKIFDGQEVEDHNGFTWIVEGFNVDLEEVEEEFTVEEAVAILDDFVATTDRDSDEYRIAKAAEVVLTDHRNLSGRVDALTARVRDQEERITALSARLQQVVDATCPNRTEETSVDA